MGAQSSCRGCSPVFPSRSPLNAVDHRFATLTLFDLPLVNATQAEVLDHLDAVERPQGRPYRVAFINAHCVNVMASDAHYREVLRSADILLPDGSGLSLAAKMVGGHFVANLNGTDLYPVLCERLARSGRSLYLLGARPEIAAAAGAAMQARYPGLIIAGTRDGYFKPDEIPAVIAAINASGADTLLVGFGVPAQDLWLAKHAPQLATRLSLGVGGLFDYYSGRIPRAPLLFRKLGVEWLWRLAQEPGRLAKRYLLGNFSFVARAMIWALKRKKSAG